MKASFGRLFLLARVAGGALRVNVLRSFLTMLGIIIGVGSVIVMVAMGAGAQSRVDSFIEGLGGNVLIVFGGWRGNGPARLAAGAVQTLSEDHIAQIQAQIPFIESAAPVVEANAQLVAGNLNWSSQVIGSDNRFMDARNWPLASGRLFTAQEARSSARVMIIGQTVATELFGAADPLGQSVRVNNFNAEVIGVLSAKGQDNRGDDQDDTVVLPIQTVRSRLTGIMAHNPRQIQMAFIKVQDGADLSAVEAEVRALLRQAFRVPAGTEEDPFNLRNLTEMIAGRAETTRVFNNLLAAVASVSLVVGGIGIMNIMLVSVTERTREIGLRMAVGARPADILAQFLIEAVVLCAAGGAVGIAVAFLLVEVLSRLTEFEGLIRAQVVFLSIGFSALIGVFFGYYPAWKASHLQPIDALRHE